METPDRQNNNSPTSTLELVEGVFIRWFVPLLGLVYASGFLIVFTFLRRYGITNIEFVEAKYIHVGSFFLMAGIAIIMPFLWMPYWLPFLRKQSLSYPHTTRPTIWGASMMLTVLFSVIAFAPVGFFRLHPWEITLNLFLPALLLVTGLLADKLHIRRITEAQQFFDKSIINFSQWIIAAIQFFVMVVTVKQLDGLWKMLHADLSCLFFVVLMLLVFLYGKRLLYRLPQAKSRGQKFNLIFSNGCIMGLFIYFAIWNFACSIYTFIPAFKGGGDFSLEPSIHLVFKPDSLAGIPAQVIAANNDNHLVILEQTDKLVYLADKTAADGAENWWKTRPPVYEVQMDTITTIEHDNTLPL